MKQKKSWVSRVVWGIVFVALIVLTVYAVTAQSESFSLALFWQYITEANLFWLGAALVCMLGFIYFEGHAISYLCRLSGDACRKRNGFAYACYDIYFSAITPSATGGQPAAAFAMMRDKIHAATTTMALLMNLMMYNVSLMILALFCFIACPSVYMGFAPLAKILIWAGIATQAVMTLLFFLLVFRSSIVIRLADWGLRILSKLRLIKNPDERKAALETMAEEYRSCTKHIWRKPKSVLYVFLLNFLQRLSHLGVTVCVFLALGGKAADVLRVFALQGFAVLGSNSVPIPGAVGVADYMFINGFSSLLSTEQVVHFELLCRSISFYFCIILAALVVLFNYILYAARKRRRAKENA